MLTCKKINKIYNQGKDTEVKAIYNLSYAFQDGEFTLIEGKSGSGKSTLLHIISLIDEATSGELLYEGENLLNYSVEEKRHFRLETVGYIFQESSLMGELTVLENVILPGIRLGQKSKTLKERGMELLKNVDIQALADRYPDEISGGQQQRVAIARSLINKPKILIADEPTANLDSSNSTQIMKLLKSLQKKEKLTIILVSHDPDDEKYADIVLNLKDGILSF